MSDLRYEDYRALVLREKQMHPEWRLGQTYFNVLYRERPDLSERVRGTALDPFHDDNRVPAFRAFVAELWPACVGPTDE